MPALMLQLVLRVPSGSEGLAQVDAAPGFSGALAVPAARMAASPLPHAPGAEGILRHCQQLPFPASQGAERLILQGEI